MAKNNLKNDDFLDDDDMDKLTMPVKKDEKDFEEKAVEEFFSRLKNLENEIKLLNEDKKNLFEEYKNKISKASFNLALKVLKGKAKLKDYELNKYERYEKILEEKFSIEQID